MWQPPCFCAAACIYVPFSPGFHRGVFSLGGGLHSLGCWQESRAVQWAPNMSQPPLPSLLLPWLCRVVTSSQKYFYKATSQCLTISCAWYKLQIVPRGTRQWEARDLLQISLWEHAFGSSAVGNFIFRDREVHVFAHWVGGWIWSVMQVPVGGGQKRTGWSLCLHTGLSAPRSKGAVGWRPCCEGLETALSQWSWYQYVCHHNHPSMGWSGLVRWLCGLGVESRGLVVSSTIVIMHFA